MHFWDSENDGPEGVYSSLERAQACSAKVQRDQGGEWSDWDNAVEGFWRCDDGLAANLAISRFTLDDGAGVPKPIVDRPGGFRIKFEEGS